jgi:cellobiose transport system permease protein
MVALNDSVGGSYVIYRRVLAGAFAATVPLIVLLLIGGRQIVRGIMEGAAKS